MLVVKACERLRRPNYKPYSVTNPTTDGGHGGLEIHSSAMPLELQALCLSQ